MNRFAMIAVLGLAACTGDEGKSDSGTTTDTGTTPPGALVVEDYDISCSGGSATLSATTSQPGFDGVVVAQETGSVYENPDGDVIQFQEEHDLTSSGTTMSVTLDVNDDPPGIYPSTRNESSTFTCSGHYNDAAFMSYAFFAYGEDGTIVDCLAGGGDGAGLKNGDYADVAVGDGLSPDVEAFLPNCVVGTPAR